MRNSFQASNLGLQVELDLFYKGLTTTSYAIFFYLNTRCDKEATLKPDPSYFSKHFFIFYLKFSLNKVLTANNKGGRS